MNSTGDNRLYGYTGRLLRVDLTEGKVSTEKVAPELLRKFLGGVGYGAKLYYDEIPAGADSLSPQNKLIFTTGPLTGTKSPGGGNPTRRHKLDLGFHLPKLYHTELRQGNY